MIKLSNVSIYNLKDEVIYSKSSGNLDQQKSDSSFETSLNLSLGDGKLVIGESYYAIGIRDDDLPIRTQTMNCIDASDNPRFEGSIAFPEKPQGAMAGNTLKATSEADILIDCFNYSSSEFNRSTWGAALEYFFGGLTNSPGPVLMATAGRQTIGASQNWSSIDEGPADICLSWVNKNINFGVWIHFNFQLFGLGDRPIWYVATNGGSWKLAGSDPSVPYTWDPSAVGFNITATPTSGHQSLSVEVVITDIKK
jgi:hypothetical protein